MVAIHLYACLKNCELILMSRMSRMARGFDHSFGMEQTFSRTRLMCRDSPAGQERKRRGRTEDRIDMSHANTFILISS